MSDVSSLLSTLKLNLDAALVLCQLLTDGLNSYNAIAVFWNSPMSKRYIVALNDEEQQYLKTFTTTGKRGARQINHARILLQADANQASGGCCDSEIHNAIGVSVRTIERVRQRFVEEGLEAAIKQRPGSGRKRKMQGEQEAHLIALRCSEPPVGHARWTLRLLADQMVELGYIDELSHETVRGTLKKMHCSLGAKPAG